MNGKRTRGRSGRNKPSNLRNQTFDSSGPEGKVRGSANQVFEKYLALARDAQSSGDRIGAENYFQHAEHYFRILSVNAQADRSRPQANGSGPSGVTHGRGNGGTAPQAEDPAHAPQPAVDLGATENGAAASPEAPPARSRKASPRNGSGADDPSTETADT